MSKLTEDDIEMMAVAALEKLGYRYFYGPDIAPDSENPQRSDFSETLLLEPLAAAISRLNPTLPAAAQVEAKRELQRLTSPELIANNESFHRLLTEGIPVSYQKDGSSRGDLIWLVDFENPENNEYWVVNQFTVIETSTGSVSVNKRPDLILFVNGLPLVVIELKNAADENATLLSAFKQLQTYKESIPSLFTYNGLLIISDGLEAQAGSLSAGFSRFMAWKVPQIADEESGTRVEPELGSLIQHLLSPSILLDLIRHFTVFDKSKKEDIKTGIATISTTKKVAAYHQYYAVNKAVDSTLRAVDLQNKSSAIGEDPALYGLPSVKTQPKGDRKAGVVWHTQGSGKSLSMVFYAGKIVLTLDNPTIVVITDRNDLDDQLFDTFASSRQLLRQEPIQAENREHLKSLLKVASGGVIFTTIQKFQPDEGNVYETLSERKNIIVIADEAHRTQYGFRAKTIDAKDEAGQVIGKKIVYGFAKYLRDALPQATYLGFTGTPIEAISNPTNFVGVPSDMVGRGERYALEIDGDSMIEAGIYDGDTVVIEKCDTAENGTIVVALVDDSEATLKRIRKKGDTIALEPANKDYETQIFGPDRIKVQGKLVGLIRSYH